MILVIKDFYLLHFNNFFIQYEDFFFLEILLSN